MRQGPRHQQRGEPLTEPVPIRTEIPPVDLEAMTNPQGYVMEDGDLGAAANAALILGKPLLLTGEAGVGKSQFANWLAYQLGRDGYLKFVVKSTTEARDLFYQYDALARFHAAQIAEALNGARSMPGRADRDSDADALRYISYNALGKAVLSSMGRAESEKQGLLSPAMGNLLGQIPESPVRTVVLIDEIDKAPRDVPNDILDEIDNHAFTVRELDNRLARANPDFYPVVVITSNSERDLPKPFLRRCIYYHMGFPSDATLERILERRIGSRYAVGEGMLAEGIRLFRHLKERAGLRQPPGLAELLDWLFGLAVDYDPNVPDLRRQPHLQAITKSTLLKDRNDQGQFDRDWASWLDQALGPADRAAG